MRKLFALFCALCIFVCATGCSKAPDKSNKDDPKAKVIVYNSKGETIASISRIDFPDSELSDPSYRSYVTLALSEAVQLFSELYLCDTNEAAAKLFSVKHTLYTELDTQVHAAINTMYSLHINENISVGCSVVDYSGKVLAVFSGGDEQAAIMGHAPFSTIKPLSVYAPAMDKGLINWSTLINDRPYKQLPDETGKLQDWPQNPKLTYTYQNTLIVDCIKQSLNTTAVHCLKNLGVKNSIDFLKNSFNINVDYENNKLTLKGEDEVIGNVALGYLYQGITPANLAGCYQIFGNGGKYIKPQALMKIESSGKTLYTFSPKPKQVISEDTAYLMNRMLSSVVSAGGTGQKARIEGVELIGKTGTGDSNGGNWFVGVTPQYSCAVWHSGNRNTTNKAAAMFTEIFENMPQHTVKNFNKSATVRKGVFCSESGMIFSDKCSHMQIGYYAQGNRPSDCTAH